MDGQARIVWKLARNHSWGTPMDAEAVIRMAATDEDHDEIRRQLEAALPPTWPETDPGTG